MVLEGLFAYTGGKPFDAERPCVVFLHGAQHDHSVWILQSRYLAHHGYAVLALDLPGHGRSCGPAATSVEAIADRIAQPLSSLANPRLLLAGHSMGSLVALELAQRLAERIAGVALCATAFPMRVSDALLTATREDPPAAMDMINVWSHSASIASFAARPGCPAPGFNVVWQNLRLMQRIARVNGLAVLPWMLACCVWMGLFATAYNYLWCAERAGLGSLIVLLGLAGLYLLGKAFMEAPALSTCREGAPV